MESPMPNRLFVYGTLAPGRPNEHVLADLPGSWQPASVTGTLLQDGWGAAAGYPGIVLDEHGARVEGLLFSSDRLADHWARLDQFEGDGYERVLTLATLDDGTTVNAYVYKLSAKKSPPTPAGSR
jgi:gamma-glutamylcyclotransferase (GGCT)/AIG2-like uncharacterized protein YtfP